MATVNELRPELEGNQARVTAVSVLGMIHYPLLAARARGFL